LRPDRKRGGGLLQCLQRRNSGQGQQSEAEELVATKTLKIGDKFGWNRPQGKVIGSGNK
jgi:hypothetical protein